MDAKPDKEMEQKGRVLNSYQSKDWEGFCRFYAWLQARAWIENAMRRPNANGNINN